MLLPARMAMLLLLIALTCVTAGALSVAPLQADEHTLVLYRFEEDGPQIRDEGPLGLHATMVEAGDEDQRTVEAPARTAGMSGQALTFGPRQALQLPDTPAALGEMQQLTVELWFRGTSEDPARRQRMAIYWEHYLLSIFANGQLMGHIYDQDAAYEVLRGRTPILRNQWYHVALTWDGERAVLWLNGRQEASVAMTGTINPSPGSGLRLGATTGEWFEGQIDEFRISSIARTVFPEALRHGFCRPVETRLVAGISARMIFDPVVPDGTGAVTCTLSLGDVSASTELAEDAFEPLCDGWRVARAELPVEIAANLQGDLPLAGEVSYQHDGETVTFRREFPVTVEPLVEPPAEEVRGAWTHSHRINYADDLFSRMAAARLNTAVMRVRRGEKAYYASELGPVSEVPFANEHLLEDCVAACERYGIDLHCYVNNFPVGAPDSEYSQRLRAAGRWQKNSAGEDVEWLCPSDPENLALVEAAMVELVRDYEIAGVQYDFIRYGGADACFCDRCRAAFEARIGHPVANWPADCRPEGALYDEWEDQRADLITAAVRRTSAAVRATDPDAVITAAVLALAPERAKQAIGQEWDLWSREGLVDGLCVMSYMADHTAYEEILRIFRDTVDGQVPVYAGIGLRSSNQAMRYPEELAAKINTVRRLGMPGFVMFAITPPTDTPETVITPLRDPMLPGNGRAE